VIHEGAALVCPARLTVEECLKVIEIADWAMKKARPAAARQRKIWGAGHIEKMVAAGTPRADAEKTVKQWAKGDLYPDALIEFISPNMCVTVREILADPIKYDGRLCEHPIEGSDYVARGKFFAESQIIFTFGHGGQVFRLHSTKEGL
jgi:hypothetical protein